MKILVEFENGENTELNNLTFLNAIMGFINEHNSGRLKHPTLFNPDEFLDFPTMAKMHEAQAEFCAGMIKDLQEAAVSD